MLPEELLDQPLRFVQAVVPILSFLAVVVLVVAVLVVGVIALGDAGVEVCRDTAAALVEAPHAGGTGLRERAILGENLSAASFAKETHSHGKQHSPTSLLPHGAKPLDQGALPACVSLVHRANRSLVGHGARDGVFAAFLHRQRETGQNKLQYPGTPSRIVG